ncbi:MAG: Fic family protein [Bacteroidetes bacterium]|nr:Fic family protein [Bacteroidota bacterium]
MQWDELNKWVQKFESLKLNIVVDFEQFNRIAIVHHSSAIEGSTLTLEETTLLITEGITAKGKSMSEHEMVKDHYRALLFCLDKAKNRIGITPEFLKQINALVNKNTGQQRSTPLGMCDDTKGDFRLGNVTAGTTYFVNYDKVPSMVNELCQKLQSKINSIKTNEEVYELSFNAHYYLVSIHPWFDGNGRTARLLMNYIQAAHKKPLSIVFLEDKSAYIKALNDSREKNNIDIFRNFMCSQYIKYMKREIEKYEQRNKGINFLFLFLTAVRSSVLMYALV